MSQTSAQPSASRIDRLPRSTRRVIAVASLIGLPAMYAWSTYWLTTSVSNLIWGPISFLLIGMTVVGSLILYRFVRNRADLSGGDLDERQRQLRDRAWILSYEVLATIVVFAVAVVAVLVIGLGREIRLDGSLISATALTVGVLIPVLPVAALAWIEPDAPPEP